MIAIPICQSILVNTLRSRLALYTTAVSPETVIEAGPYDLQSLALGDPDVLEALRKVYAVALQHIYTVALSAACAAAVCTFGMEMKNIKQVKEARRIIENNEGSREIDGSRQSKTELRVSTDVL